MELLQLTYFCDAARSENFSRTAQKFSVPPSDISQSIKRLEKELGTELFARGANSIKLNATGESFFKKVAPAIAVIEGAKKEISSDAKNETLNVCINANRRIVMQAIEKFSRQYPSVDIQTKSGVRHTSEQFNLVIDSTYPDSADFEVRRLLSERICLAVKNDDPIAISGSFSADELHQRPFVTMTDSHSLHDLTVSLCRDMGFTPRIAVQSDDPYYVRKCVELGLGVAFVPEVTWRGQLSGAIALLPLDHVTRDTYVFYDRTGYMSATTEAFYKMLSEEFERESEA